MTATPYSRRITLDQDGIYELDLPTNYRHVHRARLDPGPGKVVVIEGDDDMGSRIIVAYGTPKATTTLRWTVAT